MSRMGARPLKLPEKVTATLGGEAVVVKGPLGELKVRLVPFIRVIEKEHALVAQRDGDSIQARANHGLVRSLLNNALVGVTKGFRKDLEINGVGYRAELKGQELHMTLGYSHPVVYRLPQGIQAVVDKQTLITVTGVDRQQVGQVAAEIRQARPPEPYKGKGIKYAEEIIKRKVGKATGAK